MLSKLGIFGTHIEHILWLVGEDLKIKSVAFSGRFVDQLGEKIIDQAV